MQKPPSKETVFDVVVRALTPCLGANMARAIARGQCEKLGITSDRPSSEKLATLTQSLRPGLNVFVGRDQTDHVLAELARALGDGGNVDG